MAAIRTVIPLSGGTGIPLSERFQQTRQQTAQDDLVESPFRMNLGGTSNRTVKSGFSLGLGFNRADNVAAPRSTLRRRPTQNQNLFQGFGSRSGLTNNSNLLAVKEAEIRRLRSQLQILKAHLIVATSQQHGGFDAHRVLRSTAFKGGAGVVGKRAGGGIRFGNRGRQLNLSSKKKASGLFNRLKSGTSPMNRNANGTKSTSLNFFGEPRSKEDLDGELEAYMSKSKGKMKTDLDTELDEYMKVARQQSFAAKAGLLTSIATTSAAATDTDGDASMEVV